MLRRSVRALPSLVPFLLRASSPSRARKRLMFCTKAVVPKPSVLSKISYPTLLYYHFHKISGWILVPIGLAAIFSQFK